MGGHDQPGYRPDVDGLRALAIMFVLAYHAFPAQAPGGFVGVDVFFVVSGYLITGILLRALDKDRFTFRGFYARRVRRLVPALVLVLAATLAVGWWGLLPADFRQLGRHVAAGSAFVSNLQLWHEAGYFDARAELKPLLHLWSLGVEEQFYLVWPVALVLCHRRGGRIGRLILGVALASFAVNVLTTIRAPSAAFYSPISRFWELMVGSGLAYAQHRSPWTGRARRWDAAAATAVGVGLLLCALYWVNPSVAFPGWWALLPALGTGLLLLGGPSTWLHRNVLAQRSLVYVGRISYPLYLWHWPLLVFARLGNGGQLPAPAVRVGLLLAAVALAMLTYELLEQRVRYAPETSRAPRVVPWALATLGVLGGLGVLVSARGLLPSRTAGLPQVATLEAAAVDWEDVSDGVIPGDLDARVLLVGDSHMQQYLPRVTWLLAHRTQPARSIQIATRAGCAPFPGLDRRGLGCADAVAHWFALARAPQVETVVIAASWQGFVERDDVVRAGWAGASGRPLVVAAPENRWIFDGFEAALRELVRADKQVILVGSSPRNARFSPRSMLRYTSAGLVVVPTWVSRAEARDSTAWIDAQLRRIAARVGATYIDPVDALCSPHACAAVDGRGRPLYKDGTHLRATTARERFAALDRFVLADSVQVAGNGHEQLPAPEPKHAGPFP